MGTRIVGLLMALVIGSPAMRGNAAETRPASAPSTGRWRALADYPRPSAPDTGWGIHDNPNCTWVPQNPADFFRKLKQTWGFSWFKVLACGENKLDVVRACRAAGVEPVVRLYASRPAPHYPRPGEEEAEFRRLVHRSVEAGARYIESGNEPNLSLEWAEGEWEKGRRVQRICRQWLRVKPIIDQEGGIGVFYAMSVGGEDGRSAGLWWKDVFETFKRWDMIDEAFAGAAFGVHLGPANHPLDYPFDPQRNMPHATREERIDSLMKNNTCYLGVELLIHLMGEYLPQPIPILSTEGGAFPDNHDDKSYPPVTPELHRDLNLGIFRRMNPAAEGYWGGPLFAQMSWIWHADAPPFELDSWHGNPKYGDLPILDALQKEPRFDRGRAFKKD